MASRRDLGALALAIDPVRQALCAEQFRGLFEPPSRPGPLATRSPHAIATLLGTAYPALLPVLLVAPEIARSLAAEGFAAARDRASLRSRMMAKVSGFDDEDRVRRELRRATREEYVRIALRELLPVSLGGADIDVTAPELSALADVAIQIAFEAALFTTSARFGDPRTASGRPGRFAVLGMGKLGGDELNAGSDVDLLYLYDTDDGAAQPPSGEALSLHDFWSRVARKLTSTLDEVTPDGFVFRVDLRLRPEGRSGPIVNSLAAAERYYESFGRLWERAALLRARPVAGDLAFGEEVIRALAPFVWRRRVDPRIANEMVQLARRSRVELSVDPSRDLKLGPGGIREAEFFVQTLQLVWGGREPRLHVKNTLDALRRLRALGLVSDREFREIAAGYLALRRAEHAVQFASGIQTHVRPEAPEELRRLSRALGFADPQAFLTDVGRHMDRIAARFLSLLPDRRDAALLDQSPEARWGEAIAALERGNPEGFAEAIVNAAERVHGGPLGEEKAERFRDVTRDLLEIARHPDRPLGARTRESFPELAPTILEAVLDAADPEQAARYLRMIFARVGQPGIYARILGEDPRAVRRLVEAVGASAFVGDAVANNPELGDFVLFARGAPTPQVARTVIAEAVREAKASEDDPEEALVGALRRAKARVTIEVALADLAAEVGTREATLTLSELADATLDAATRFALGTPEGEAVRGLSVLAMGKLGGREIGYGSDLDVLFLFDPEAAPPGKDPQAHFARAARQIIRLISVSHATGPGYELDTRLRPSGSQGLLVTSLDAFARYHGDTSEDAETAPASVRVRAAAWERLALLRARAAAGDPELGKRALRVAHAAAYDMPFDVTAAREEIHRLRLRMERENSQERRGRYDVKLGRGGLVDIEFSVQFMQLRCGKDRRVRTTETKVAIDALSASGYLASEHVEALREGYGFLRKLEQRMRVVHASAAQLLEESAPGLLPLARRMGIRDLRGAEAGQELLERYREVTERVRATFEAIVAP